MSKFVSAYILLFINFSLVLGDPKVPCYFIFGDSLSDAGNNNNLYTVATANYAPYGVDFPDGLATGRFTNGLTTPDLLAKKLGFEELIAPYRTAYESQILEGVNYASGAAGILTQSGQHLGDRIWLARQVENHGKTIEVLQSILTGPVSEYLNKCLYTLNIGSSDYIYNYFLPQFYPSKANFNPDQFATALVTEYELQIKELYKYGARKTAIFGLGPIGCSPIAMRMHKSIICVREINRAVDIFNKKLVALVDSLNDELVGAKFTFIKMADIQSFAPLTLGLFTGGTCCTLREDYQCDATKPICSNRNLYAFMDGFNPTEVVNQLTATLAFDSPFNLFVHPVDIKELVSTNNAMSM